MNISQQATDAEATAANGRFSLVMASYTTKANGEEYIQRLAEEGFKEGRFFEKGKMTRVLYGHYATAEEADEALHELRNKNSEFNQAWVLEVKE